jgi:hypothetical protein
MPVFASADAMPTQCLSSLPHDLELSRRELRHDELSSPTWLSKCRSYCTSIADVNRDVQEEVPIASSSGHGPIEAAPSLTRRAVMRLVYGDTLMVHPTVDSRQAPGFSLATTDLNGTPASPCHFARFGPTTPKQFGARHQTRPQWAAHVPPDSSLVVRADEMDAVMRCSLVADFP